MTEDVLNTLTKIKMIRWSEWSGNLFMLEPTKKVC